MTPRELADSTRAWWPVNPATVERLGIRHAVAVHDGVTRALMEIGEWVRRGNRRAFAAIPLTEGPVYDECVGPLGRKVPFTRGTEPCHLLAAAVTRLAGRATRARAGLACSLVRFPGNFQIFHSFGGCVVIGGG